MNRQEAIDFAIKESEYFNCCFCVICKEKTYEAIKYEVNKKFNEKVEGYDIISYYVRGLLVECKASKTVRYIFGTKKTDILEVTSVKKLVDICKFLKIPIGSRNKEKLVQRLKTILQTEYT